MARPIAHLRTALLASLGVLAMGPASAAGLMVSGKVTEASASIEPAFLLENLTGEAPAGGPYSLQILDGAGRELSATAFDLATTFACGGGPCREFKTSFLLVLPMTPELSARMAALQLKRGDRTLAVRRSSAWSPTAGQEELQQVAPIVPGREPKAVALAPGQVRLTWDNRTHPQILVRNAEGEIISILDNGGLDLHTDSRYLDLDMSDGLRVLRHRVEVTAPVDGENPAGAGKI